MPTSQRDLRPEADQRSGLTPEILTRAAEAQTRRTSRKDRLVAALIAVNGAL